MTVAGKVGQHFRCAVLVGVVADDDREAVAREAASDRRADPSARAGDDGRRHQAPASEYPEIQQELEERLKDALGLRVKAEVVAPGALDAWTEINTSPKLKRFRDERD